MATPIYRTRTTLMIGRINQNPDPNSGDLYTGAQLAYTYAQLATKEPVLRGALESLGLPTEEWESLANQVSVNIVQQTQLFEVIVVDTDPVRAKALADAVAQKLIEETPAGLSRANSNQDDFSQTQLDDLISKIENAKSDITHLNQQQDLANGARQIQELQSQIDALEMKISEWQKIYAQFLLASQGGDVNVLTVVEAASVPGNPISPNIKMNVLLGALVGLILAIGGVILIEYLDDTIKTPEDVWRITKLPVLGNIGMILGEGAHEKLITLKQPSSPAAEAFRALRLNLQFASITRKIQTLMVTSPNPDEGKSVIVANLAVIFAQSGLKVIAIDADLRRSTLNKFFNINNGSGLSDVLLAGNKDIEQYLHKTEVDNLVVLSSGSTPPNPAELLGSERMKKLIKDLKDKADLLIFDCPPTQAVIDGAILATCLDGTILVNDVGRTSTNDARLTVEELRRLNVNLLGVVLNHQTVSPTGSYRYYQYYEESARPPGKFHLSLPRVNFKLPHLSIRRK